jgi:hypothetical protein
MTTNNSFTAIEGDVLDTVSGGMQPMSRGTAMRKGCVSGAILFGLGGAATGNPFVAAAGAVGGCIGGAYAADKVVPHQ